ncbi:MAG TPA: hypothetical protein VGT98_02630 [Candidatus Elarobacter sp.]|nr:hypothetical protein [Candidatus Elarobacter sp.]
MRELSLKWLLCGVLLALLGACRLRRFEVTEHRSGVESLAGVSVLRLDAGAGWLRIEGHEGQTEARFDGVAHASSHLILDRIRITTHRSGDTLVVVAAVPEDRAPVGQAAALDLTVLVPPGLRLDVVDRSGETIIRGVGPLRIDHGDGGLDIDGVSGDLNVHDADGDMVLLNIRGNVSIVDAGGAIYLTNVHGSVSIPSDGAGEIQVASVTGDVIVGSKRSGEVRARDIGGNLEVKAHGSGAVQYRDVRGKVTIPAVRRLP